MADPAAGGLLAAAGDGMRFTGAVKKIIPGGPERPAHGFIECAETYELYGRDVFLHDQLAAVVGVGQIVFFKVALNAKGMPQAVDVEIDEKGAGAVQDASWPTVQAAAFVGGKPSLPAVPTGKRLCELLLPAVAPALQNGMQQTVAAALIAAGELLGVTQDMRMQLAATMPAARASPYGSDPSYGKAAAYGKTQYAPGFGCKGKASNGFMAKGKGKSHYEPYAATFAASAKGNLMEASQAQSSDGSGVFAGVVKRISQPTAAGVPCYGFVDCEETREIYGRDVFLHSDQASELQVGQRVQFEVFQNQRGMPQAKNLGVM